MYIAVKERENKHNEKVFYLYLGESYRDKGVVKNKQKYLTSVKEVDLKSGKYQELFASKLHWLSDKESVIVQEKVDFLISKF